MVTPQAKWAVSQLGKTPQSVHLKHSPDDHFHDHIFTIHRPLRRAWEWVIFTSFSNWHLESNQQSQFYKNKVRPERIFQRKWGRNCFSLERVMQVKYQKQVWILLTLTLLMSENVLHACSVFWSSPIPIPSTPFPPFIPSILCFFIFCSFF